MPGIWSWWVERNPLRNPGNQEKKGLVETVPAAVNGVLELRLLEPGPLLQYNFQGGREPPCLAACDANGDGEATGEVSDAVYLLLFNFAGGAPPPPPFPDCGAPDDPGQGCGEPPAGFR